MLARLLLAFVIFGAAPALAQNEGPYLFDLLGDGAYRAAWNGMLNGEAVPDWVAAYAEDFDGPSSPSTKVSVGGEPYTLAWVCKAHDCGDNQLYVLFAPAGRQAWGLLISGGDQRQWLGNPDAAVQAAILSGVQ
ncbi:MAG: Ivy family c-type lysozyme inhibitor [Methyloceanibacter sp.]|uniref:Ivy family c-type lysozyme inhibitor n=1 Tax=Methyloceanibacter sp. TaxID=1965321 RepID=UPI003D6D3F3C